MLFLPNEANLIRIPCNKSTILTEEIYPDIDRRAKEFIGDFINLDALPTFNRDNDLIHRGPSVSSVESCLVLTINSFCPHLHKFSMGVINDDKKCNLAWRIIF